MVKFIIKRVLAMIPQLFILSLLVFMLTKAMPGDPISASFLNNPNLDPEVIEELKEKHGLNDPWYVQYTNWIKRLLQGDLGVSYVHKVKISKLLGERFANTVVLGAATLIISYLIAIPLGIIAGRYQDSLADKLIVGYNYFSYAVPLFVFALLMLFIFGFRLGWFPTSGSV
ncbi:MAG: ABC transporter permease, partial [Caldibacillus sp.]